LVADTDYDTWVICRHTLPESGQSAVITVNSSLEKRLSFSDYPQHVSIVIEAETHSLDARGRINAHESQHLLLLSRVIREHLDPENEHLIAIVHGAGARTLCLHARDGEALRRRLNALLQEKRWDRTWTFEMNDDPCGRLSEPWRDLARSREEHHLAVNIPHAGALDHHHFLF
jgi:hypothetical protein